MRGAEVHAVRTIKGDGSDLLSRNLSLCRSLVRAGLVDRLRFVMFPVITGGSGPKCVCHGYPDVGLQMIDARTFDRRMVDYGPRVLEQPPLDPP